MSRLNVSRVFRGRSFSHREDINNGIEQLILIWFNTVLDGTGSQCALNTRKYNDMRPYGLAKSRCISKVTNDHLNMICFWPIFPSLCSPVSSFLLYNRESFPVSYVAGTVIWKQHSAFEI